MWSQAVVLDPEMAAGSDVCGSAGEGRAAARRIGAGPGCVGGDLVDEVAVGLGVGKQVAEGGVLVLGCGGCLVAVEDLLLFGEVGDKASDVAGARPVLRMGASSRRSAMSGCTNVPMPAML